MPLSKRTILKSFAALATAGALPVPLRADGRPIELSWSDLVPEEAGKLYDDLRMLGVIQHGELSTPFDQETGVMITNAYDGANVRIPGYLVPVDFDGTAIVSGLLVPFVGACIHVPPPPPNQLIFFTSDAPYESKGLFEAIYVTGLFAASSTETALAEIGYTIEASRIEPYS